MYNGYNSRNQYLAKYKDDFKYKTWASTTAAEYADCSGDSGCIGEWAKFTEIDAEYNINKINNALSGTTIDPNNQDNYFHNTQLPCYNSVDISINSYNGMTYPMMCSDGQCMRHNYIINSVGMGQGLINNLVQNHRMERKETVTSSDEIIPSRIGLNEITYFDENTLKYKEKVIDNVDSIFVHPSITFPYIIKPFLTTFQLAIIPTDINNNYSLKITLPKASVQMINQFDGFSSDTSYNIARCLIDSDEPAKLLQIAVWGSLTELNSAKIHLEGLIDDQYGHTTTQKNQIIQELEDGGGSAHLATSFGLHDSSKIPFVPAEVAMREATTAALAKGEEEDMVVKAQWWAHESAFDYITKFDAANQKWAAWQEILVEQNDWNYILLHLNFKNHAPGALSGATKSYLIDQLFSADVTCKPISLPTGEGCQTKNIHTPDYEYIKKNHQNLIDQCIDTFGLEEDVSINSKLMGKIFVGAFAMLILYMIYRIDKKR